MSDENEKPKAPAAPKKISTDSSAQVVAEFVDAAAKSKSPWVPIVAVALGILTGGGGISFGWNASSEARAAFEALSRKVDRITEELAEIRKAETAAVARAQAERHEERIRDLEKQAQSSILERQQLRLELEALKRSQK